MNTERGLIDPPTSLLIWLAGALGDTLLAYPALAAWRSWAPDCALIAVGRPAHFRLAARAGLVDLLLDVDGPAGDALWSGRLPPGLVAPQVAVVWSTAYGRLSGSLADCGIGRVLAYPARASAAEPQAAYLRRCLAPLGLPTADGPLHLSRAALPASSLPIGLLPPAGERTALLHPGAGGRWKRWPLDRFVGLADDLRAAGYAVRWSCGPDDGDLRVALRREGAGAWLWPELDLPEYAAALSRCSLLVSPDTGVAHLAALLEVPQVTLFGPTDPRRWAPFSPAARVVRALDRCGGAWPPYDAARPARGLRRCPGEQGGRCACLEGLGVEEVLRALPGGIVAY